MKIQELQVHIGQGITLFGKLKLPSAHSGSQIWAMLPSSETYNYLTLSSNLNLSTAANPYFAFWAKKADGGGGYVSLEASTDGGNNWTIISQPNISGSAWNFIQVSLSNFKQTNVLVRIGCQAHQAVYISIS